MAVLTVSAVVAAAGGVLSSIASGAIAVLKVVASVFFAGVFFVAVQGLLALLYDFTMGSVVGEVFALISVCLPFNALVLFGSIFAVCNAILAFLIARKVYLLTSNLISVSSH